MKAFISSILLLTWVAFIGFGTNQPLLHPEKKTPNMKSCHAQKVMAEEKKDCCSKFNSKEPEEKECNADDEKQKGCCKDNNCPRTCCQVVVAFNTDNDNDPNVFGIIDLSHGTHPSPHLPSPYLENSHPPPNVNCDAKAMLS